MRQICQISCLRSKINRKARPVLPRPLGLIRCLPSQLGRMLSRQISILSFTSLRNMKTLRKKRMITISMLYHVGRLIMVVHVLSKTNMVLKVSQLITNSISLTMVSMFTSSCLQKTMTQEQTILRKLSYLMLKLSKCIETSYYHLIYQLSMQIT